MSKWLGIREGFEAKENISYGANIMRDGVSSVVIIDASRHQFSRITLILRKRSLIIFW
ncbi:MAG: hypothetical protein H0U27_01030 [Nitrosopumilus sp.]|nr:hypothetical protein [Nitrosopumilus sp.]